MVGIAGKVLAFQRHGARRHVHTGILLQEEPDEKPVVEPTGDAFLLQDDGKTRFYVGDTSKTTKAELWATTKKLFENATEGKRVCALDSGATYELFYWNKGWKSLGTKQFVDKKKPLIFDKVPADRVYWLIKKDETNIDDRDERIFTLEDGKMVWW